MSIHVILASFFLILASASVAATSDNPHYLDRSLQYIPCLRSCDDGGNTGCKTEDISRFLFAGQSNMVGYTEEAKEGLFDELVEVILRKGVNKKDKLEEMEGYLNMATRSEAGSSKMEAKEVYKLRKFIKRKNFMDEPYAEAVCSWTEPPNSLDCERPVSPTACGKNFGPELMFAHAFQMQNTRLKNKKIGIVKVAKGGTTIRKNWMKVNVGEEENYWHSLVDAISASKGSIEAFVWFQGENDQFIDGGPESYLDNLNTFVADIREEIFKSSDNFQIPEDIPVVICELGNWIYNMDMMHTINNAQRTFVNNTANTILVEMGVDRNENQRLSAYCHYDPAGMMIIGDRVAKAVKKILNEA